MALPPDTADSFVREVDENLRRDRARDFSKRYGWMIGAAVLLMLRHSRDLQWQFAVGVVVGIIACDLALLLRTAEAGPLAVGPVTTALREAFERAVQDG